MTDHEQIQIEAANGIRQAETLRAETGLPVSYDYHTGLQLRRGPLVATRIEPTAEAVRREWDRLGASPWQRDLKMAGDRYEQE